MAPVIAVDHLVKRYGDFTAVRDVSFGVEAGEIFGILGPNGSGKTTTVESLQGLRSIEGGSVSVLGLDPRTQAPEIRRRVGAQLQESALPDRIKVWEALELFSSTSSRGPAWRDVMAEWGLDEKRNARFGSLSGGQKQRLFVALSLVNDPEIVFLDEMTTGLDPASRRVAWDLIRAVRTRGTTVVLVTHFMDEAAALCDRLCVINRGEVAAAGTVGELVDRFGGGVRVRFSLDGDADGDGVGAGWLADTPHVTSWTRDHDRYEVHGEGPVLAYVAAALVEHGTVPTDLRQERASLEDVFLKLTGEAAE